MAKKGRSKGGRGGKGFGGGGKGFGKSAPGQGTAVAKARGAVTADRAAPAPVGVGASAAPPAPAAASAPKPDVGAIIDSLDEEADVFWQLIPHILTTDAALANADLSRVLAMVEFVRGRRSLLDADVVSDAWRPEDELHAYMPGIAASPWHDPSTFEVTAELEANYETIRREFEALLADGSAHFQTVTEMNYESGWKTLVLRYNSQTMAGFPYHLCPVTHSILQRVPVAGRIAGFNRQLPTSGIPAHTDGNNMWLTLQMGIALPQSGGGEGGGGAAADEGRPWISVGGERRHWEEGKCLVYDTTYVHETFNPSREGERVVLHVDFWNAVHTRVPPARPAAEAAGALSEAELSAMRKVYELRERFLEAEGVSRVAEKRL